MNNKDKDNFQNKNQIINERVNIITETKKIGPSIFFACKKKKNMI